MSRNTTTGLVLERMILPALEQAGYSYKVQTKLGQRFGISSHVVDAVAEKDGKQILISVKWQQVSGTAEQVPFEIICLLEAIEAGPYEKAYLVLGGEGWKFRGFYTSGGLTKYLSYANRVEIVTLEGFVAKANSGKL
jgi:hypothetical protein